MLTITFVYFGFFFVPYLHGVSLKKAPMTSYIVIQLEVYYLGLNRCVENRYFINEKFDCV